MTKITSLLIGISVVLSVTACKKDQLPDQTSMGQNLPEQGMQQAFSENNPDAYHAKLSELQSQNPVYPVADRGPVTYKGTLCGFDVSAVHATAFSLSDPQFWDYYEFSGNAGDEVTVWVQRTSAGMDPYAEIRLGTITDSDNWYGLMLVAAGDDNVEDAFNSCSNDPYITVTLSESGTFTLGVADFISCGSPLSYKIVTTGIHCDTDGDGVYEVDDNCPTVANAGQENCDGDALGDACDAHPCSNEDVMINIDGLNTNIPNVQVGGGSNMMDLILDCAANANNHGAFVSCMASLTNDWVAIGLITGEQKGIIMNLATGANIP